ncbi:MAG: ABC-type amino acid transport system permease subunit [Paracoccaceae bacterium]
MLGPVRHRDLGDFWPVAPVTQPSGAGVSNNLYRIFPRHLSAGSTLLDLLRAAVVGRVVHRLHLWRSGLGAEIFRGSVQSVPKSQWEAALALNMSPWQRMRRIIIPQTYPALLPPAANLTIELLKATALVALITVVDLMFVAKQINATSWMSAQTFGTALLVYYVMARFVLTPFLRWLETLAARKMGLDRRS